MSDHIPFEIQTEIIKNLPVKSLIRFRSVSKPWKSLIDSSEFIVNYHVNHPQPQHHLFVRYVDAQELYEWDLEDEYYLSIADDDSFPQNQTPMFIPDSIELLGKLPLKLGTSQGLFAFYNTPLPSNWNKTMTVVIWNPTIGKSVTVVVPNMFRNYPFQSIVGFGVCPRTMDPMLVKVTYISSLIYNTNTMFCIPFQVEVYKLSLGTWRSSTNNMPRKSISLGRNPVSVDRFIYWLSTDRIPRDDSDGYYLINMILSFDMISEEFADVYLPKNLARHSDSRMALFKLKTSLVILEINTEREYNIWKMENGAPNSFKKLFAIKAPEASLCKIVSLVGFRKNDEPIIDVSYDNDEQNDALFVYRPQAKGISYIGINGSGFPCLASSYVETLLLHDH